MLPVRAKVTLMLPRVSQRVISLSLQYKKTHSLDPCFPKRSHRDGSRRRAPRHSAGRHPLIIMLRDVDVAEMRNRLEKESGGKESGRAEADWFASLVKSHGMAP